MDPKAVSAHWSVMKAMYFQAAGALALTFAIAACVPSTEPPAAAPPPPPAAATPASAPSLTPAPAPAPPPPTPVVQEPVFENYLDAPQTPGTWTYVDEPSESLALFGDRPDAPDFIIRCAGGQLALARTVRPSPARSRLMSITTETTSRQLEATPIGGRPLAAAMLAPRDPLLDAMAITKGRFAVGVEGEPTLYLPAWAEVTRVIEDCR